MGYVFLANAVNRVGKFLFPDEWDGSENFTETPYNFWTSFDGQTWRISSVEATIHQKVAIHRLLVSYRPEFGRSPTIERGPFGPIVPEFSGAEWNAGIDEAERINRERKPKLERRTQVRRFIKSAILEEKLRYVLLPLRGGRFSDPQDRTWWNVKDHDRIFYWCQMNPKDPLGVGVGGDTFRYVFVDGGDLTELLTSEVDDEQQMSPIDTSDLDLPDFRDERTLLIESVRSGVRFLAEAEEIARAKGFEPLVSEPNPADYPVMELDDWTFEMALAWIIWREPMQVLNFHEPYFNAANPVESPWGWTPKANLGGIMETLELEDSLTDLGKHPKPVRHFSYEGGVAELLKALEGGAVTADATHLPSMKSFYIPQKEWKRLLPSLDPKGRAILVNKVDVSVAVYGDVLFDRREVVANWPAEELGAEADQTCSPQRKARPASKRALLDHLKQMVQFAKVKGVVPPSRTEAVEMLQGLLPGTARQQIHQAMDEGEVAQLFPNKPGPRGKRNPNRAHELSEIRQFLSAAELPN